MEYNDQAVARWVGLLFLVATAAYMTGNGLTGSILETSGSIANIQSEQWRGTVGVMLELVNCAAVVGISVLLYPILKRYNEAAAIGYLGARMIEAALLAVGAALVVALLLWRDRYAVGDPEWQIVAALAASGKQAAFEVAMLALGVGSIMFCWLLYQTKLVPPVMALLGIVGYLALTASSCLGMMGLEPGWVLFVPGGLFEVIFPLWLMIKGFRQVG